MGKVKVDKTGIRNAIIFYEEEYTKVPRMVLFGDVSDLLPFYTKMTKLGFERLRNIYEVIFKRPVTEDEIMDLLDGYRPKVKNKKYAISEKATMSLSYAFDDELVKQTKVQSDNAN